MQQRLLRTPPLEYDESLLGYVIRLTEANHYDNGSWVTNHARLNVNFSMGGWMRLNRDDTDLTSLETLTGLHHGTLESLKYQVARWKRTVRFQGISLSAAVMKLNCPKVCSACLRESNYCRRVWDLLSYTACPQHQVVLLDTCPGCRGRVSWARSRVSRCRCGFDLRNAPEVKVSQSKLKAARWISELCRSATERTTEEQNDEPLYQLGLGELCEALSLFAGHYLRVKHRVRMTAETANSACHEAVVHAFSALEEWPCRFEGFMKKCGIDRFGRPPEVRSLLALHRECREGALDFLTVAIEEFIENALSRYADQVCETPTFHKRFIPATVLAKYSVAGPRHLEWLLRSGRVRVYRKVRDGRDEVLIDLDSVDRYKEKLALCFTGAYAADSLGISVDDVTELVWHGCLTPVSGPSVDGLSEWRFCRDEPGWLLGAVTTKVPAKTEGDQREWLYGGEVLSLLKKYKISVGRFVRDVVDGKPAPQCKSRGRGLAMFAFSKKEIAEYVLAKTGEKISVNENSTPTFRQLARTLEKMKERNDSVYQRGISRRDETDDSIWANVSDLARIALLVFSRAQASGSFDTNIAITGLPT